MGLCASGAHPLTRHRSGGGRTGHALRCTSILIAVK